MPIPKKTIPPVPIFSIGDAVRRLSNDGWGVVLEVIPGDKIQEIPHHYRVKWTQSGRISCLREPVVRPRFKD